MEIVALDTYVPSALLPPPVPSCDLLWFELFREQPRIVEGKSGVRIGA